MSDSIKSVRQRDLTIKNDIMENVLSKKDLSRNLGLSIGKIDKMMGEGLNYLKIGKSVRFRESDVDRFLNDRLKN